MLQLQIDAELMLDANAQELLMSEYPADCCPVKCYIHFPCMAGDEDSPFWQGWAALRIKTFRLVENKYFETAVIAMILLSSLALVSLMWWNPPLQNIVITQGNPGSENSKPRVFFMYYLSTFKCKHCSLFKIYVGLFKHIESFKYPGYTLEFKIPRGGTHHSKIL